MSTKIILIDQDGVVASYNARLFEILSQTVPEFVQLPHAAHRHFETADNYPEKYRSLMEDIVHAPGFFRTLPPIDGAVHALHDLLSRGYDVRICTAPKRQFKNCVTEKLEWIKEHLGQEYAERTIITRDKTLVRGDYLIDDKPKITGVLVPQWEHLIFDQPYNKTSVGRRLDWSTYKEIL
jgi:5'-nucleotidase